MTTPAYPSVLSGPTLSGATLSPVDNTLRTESSDSVTFARQRTRMMGGTYGCTFVFKQNELGAFEYWYRVIIDSGRSWFTINIAGEDMIARFDDGYAMQALSGYNYTVTGRLELYELPSITEAEYNA